jgi:glycosyltransferase involved in cell wall biosynthesis
MVIGVDVGALSLSNTQPTGVWRVTSELLRALSTIDRHNQYRLYGFAPIQKIVMKQLGENMQNVILAPSLGYMKIRLPLELALHPVDIFLGLSQAIPHNIHSQTKYIGMIHDLGFLHNPSIFGSIDQRLKKQTDDLVKRSDVIITVSESIKREIVAEYGVPPSRVEVVYNGVSKMFNTKNLKKNSIKR